MKLSLVKLICCTFSVVLLMSSCLGSSENSFKEEKAFAYIATNQTGIKYAATVNAGTFTDNNESNRLSGFATGSCYYINYEIKQGSSTGPSIAEYVTTTPGYSDALPQKSLYVGKPYSELDIYTQADSIQATSISLGAYYPTDLLGDNWLFINNTSFKQGEGFTAYFYYDSSNQIDENGEEISINEKGIIVDIRFIKTQIAETENVKKEFVGNLSYLRNSLAYYVNFGDQTYKDIPVKFRYTQPGTAATDNLPKTAFFGSWSTNGYFIRYYKEQL